MPCLLWLSSGCYGDMVSTGGNDLTGEPDASVTPLPDDLTVDCADAVTTTDDGYHFPGQACGSCHNGSVAPAFSAAGTAFADTEGNQPLVGATIHLIDSNGTAYELVTALNGNFWTDGPIALPAAAFVSSCPSIASMSTLSSSGDCNSCHSQGQRITLR